MMLVSGETHIGKVQPEDLEEVGPVHVASSGNFALRPPPWTIIATVRKRGQRAPASGLQGEVVINPTTACLSNARCEST
jgi:hypothetical protein